MKATILDTKTGLRKTVDGPRSFEWAENNNSCDCNRNPWGAETGKPNGICKGCERFIVVAAEMNSPDDYEYTLAELNADYPKELLESHGVATPNDPKLSDGGAWRGSCVVERSGGIRAREKGGSDETGPS